MSTKVDKGERDPPLKNELEALSILSARVSNIRETKTYHSSLYPSLKHTHSLSPSLTSTLLFPSLSLSLSPAFLPAICHMWENRRVIIIAGTSYTCSCTSWGWGGKWPSDALNKQNWKLEGAVCLYNMYGQYLLQSDCLDSDFHPTPAKSQYTPVHATILHQHAASVPIGCTLSFCLIR